MDTTVHTPFCIPLRQQSSHAVKPGDEGEIPPRPLSLSSQPHSIPEDSSNEGCNCNTTPMDLTKGDTFATFVPRKFYLLCAPRRSESLNDNHINLAKVIPVSASQSVMISCDNPKSFLLKSVTPYAQQTTTVPKTPSKFIQPPVLSSPQLISGSLAANRTLPLSLYSFSVPTTNVTTGILPRGPYYDRAADDNLCRNRDPLLVKEMLHEGHCCESAPRRLRLKTMDGSFSGLRSNYGRPGWHDSPRQSTLSYSGPGASRFYTRPAPTLPLLPLGQAYGRGTPRRLMLNNFRESQWWVFMEICRLVFLLGHLSLCLIFSQSLLPQSLLKSGP
ncbi:hypothetical protein LOAG_06722 [Loa loa]|uniref:Uncharacterized protein n=1 Tax=Loa loa TaxID=7209 RepID=A0A1S0TXJ7_LOALO|nr:hypothetical protein LOAG_06722 [Loa loa]EFO21761.2 hypothetical protein LOAG_06722 [Loa loa]